MRTLTRCARGRLWRFRTGPACFAALGAAILFPLALGACQQSEASIRNDFGGDAKHGAVLIHNLGCGSCHEIPGVEGADGLVGPPLDRIARRVYLAGMLRNTPDNMLVWLRNPQAVVPGNAMPDMNLNDKDVRDVAAYLYTLK